MRLFFILLVFSLWHVDAMAKCEKEAKIYGDVGDWSNWPEYLSMEQARKSLNKQYEFLKWAKQQGLPVEPTTAALISCMIPALKQKLGQKDAGQKSTQSTGSKTFVLFDKFLGNKCAHVPVKTDAWYGCREPYFREYIRGCGQLENPDGSYPVARLREIMACGDKNYARNQRANISTTSAKGKGDTSSKQKYAPLIDSKCANITQDARGVGDMAKTVHNRCSVPIVVLMCFYNEKQGFNKHCGNYPVGWGTSNRIPPGGKTITADAIDIPWRVRFHVCDASNSKLLCIYPDQRK